MMIDAAVWSWLGKLLFGSERRMRTRSTQTLMAFVLYTVFAALQQAAAQMGMLDTRTAASLSAFNLAGSLGFYLAVRTGAYQLLLSDAALTSLQMLFALVCISAAYAYGESARAVGMVLMPLVMPFGAFVLSARQLAGVAAAGLAMLSGVMAWRAHGLPLSYPPRVEVLHGLAIAAAVAGATVVAISLGRLRVVMLRQRSELNEALERIQALATRDDLTGLLNRRAVLEWLQIEMRERDAEKPRVCLALIDLDHFKRVNDINGHAAGDEVLRRFADAARQLVRGTDLLARWGGEEFLLMMPGASVAQGLETLARIRTQLLARSMDDIQPGLRITFSAGVVEWPGLRDFEGAIERADAAMYAAKEAGRDRALPGDAGEQAPVQGDAAECATRIACRDEVHFEP